jgi:KUP system potassium uptake protein
MSEPSASANGAAGHAPKAGLTALTLGAVGVVYGDIGTSPLYALRESLRLAAADGVTRNEVLGVVSLLLWALILIVTLKYVLLLLRADNRGEGGILALLALVQHAIGRRTGVTFALGVAGAALFFGDAILTPAISVLSAVEGLELVTPVFGPYVLPIAVALLALLFLAQQWGTGAIAAWFGPITALWFAAMGAAGAVHIADDPGVLTAFNPLHGIGFLGQHGLVGIFVLGAVFLAVTGAEALYADLGHFGRRPIQLAWFAVVFPALALNYLGQGALVLAHPAALANPFFLMVPGWALLPLVLLAAAATLIASQAVITGAYSITRQAMQLGLLPRLEIVHTSAALSGQIYMPLVNWLLLAGVLALVLIFGTSSNLASAYGIAVSGTMLITTVLAFFYLREGRRWSLAVVLALVGPIALVEAAFVAATLLKFADGGYVPVLLAAALAVLMVTWVQGTAQLFQRARRMMVPLGTFIGSTAASARIAAVPGTAVFLTSDPDYTPPSLLHNLKHNKVLHEQVVILTVTNVDTPRVDEAERVTIERLDARFVRVGVRFGFMEDTNLGRALALCRRQGLKFDVMTTSFFLSRRKLLPEGRVGMPLWQDHIYITLAAIAADPSDFYRLPRDRVVELGSQMAV